MSAPQTSVNQNPDRGQAGGIFDLTQIKNSISGPAAEKIPYGSYVIVDADGTVRLPAAGADITNQKLKRGFAVRRHHFEQTDEAVDSYLINQSVEILTKGTIFVPLAADLAITNVIHVGFQAGEEGQFAGANSGDRDILNAAGVSVRETGTTAGDGLAVLDVNLP